jgi:diaminopimelate decarboxylase
MAAATASVYPRDSAIRDGRLEIGGCDALELAREFGTPAYVVASEDLRAAARAALTALAEHHDGPGGVLFASKAFPCTAVLRVFAEEGLGCDVASGGELDLALHAGFPPQRIVLHGNAKAYSELAAAVDAGVRYVVIDGRDDLERLEAIVPAGERQDVLVRVTPGVESDTHHAIATGHHDSKFGVPLSQAPAMLERVGASDRVALAGVHMHVGSQLLDVNPMRVGVAVLATLARFGVYDLGGGLGVAYEPEDRAPAIEEWVESAARALRELVGPGCELLLEPGRALCAAAGVTLYRIESVKRAARVWVGVDGGMSDNLRPMLYGSRYEAAVADRMDGRGEPCTLVGKHCESGDVLIEHAHLPDPRPGDVVVTPVTGAYGHAMANNYNGVPRPPVIFCSGGDARCVVRRETYEDLRARDV